MARREFHFWVYVLASRSRNLYVGMTNDLVERVARHREGVPGTHTGAYNVCRLVYFEYFQYVRSAIARETELKGWARVRKVELILKVNPTWEELIPDVVGRQGQKQVPCGNDNQKGKGKGRSKGKSKKQVPCGNDN